MNGAFTSFLSLPEQDRRDVFAAAAVRLDTLPSYVEKDFWVCLVLDLLFNRLADRHPKLLFKGRNVPIQGVRTHPTVLRGHRSRRQPGRPGLCERA